MAAAGGYLSFTDERFVPSARAALAELAPSDREAAIEQVRGDLARARAELARDPPIAAHLSRVGTNLDGYRNFSARPSAETDAVDPGELPFGDASVHDLAVDDMLAGVAHDRAGAVLVEWARVLADGGRLRLRGAEPRRVPDLVSANDPAALRRLPLRRAAIRFRAAPKRRTPTPGSRPSSNSMLPSVGFAVENLEVGTELTATARRVGTISSRSGGPNHRCAWLSSSRPVTSTRSVSCAALSQTDPGVDFETVVLVNGSDPDTIRRLRAVSGEVTLATSALILDRAVAINEAIRLAHAATVVVVSPRLRPSDGWLARLVAPLDDESVALAGAAVVGESGLVVHAGFDLCGNGAVPVLEAQPRLATSAPSPRSVPTSTSTLSAQSASPHGGQDGSNCVVSLRDGPRQIR